jgi:hypothetical protein
MESGFFLFRWHLELMTQKELRGEYFNKIIDRFEHLTQQSVKNIIFKVRFVKMILLKTIIHTRECLRNGKYIVANRVPEAKTKSKKK